MIVEEDVLEVDVLSGGIEIMPKLNRGAFLAIWGSDKLSENMC